MFFSFVLIKWAKPVIDWRRRSAAHDRTELSRHTWQPLSINKTTIVSPTSLHGLFHVTNVACFVYFYGLFTARPRGSNQSVTSCVTWVRSNVTSTNRKWEPKNGEVPGNTSVLFSPVNGRRVSPSTGAEAGQLGGQRTGILKHIYHL